MKKTVRFEKSLKNYLKSLKTDGITPGLLLGQSSSDHDFVVHLARTPIPKENSCTEICHLKQIQNLKEEWIIDHMRNVIQMLPGGMTILGLFFVGDVNLFSNSTAVACLKKILGAVDKFVQENEYYFIELKLTPKLVLNCIEDTNFICKQFSTSQSGQLDSVDCVWNCNDWHRISCYYDFQHLLPLYVKSISNVILHEKIMDILKYVSKSVKESILLLNGELKNQMDLIKNIKEKVNERIVQNATESEAPSQIVADLYAPCGKQFSHEVFEVCDYNAELKCFGTLCSDVYLHNEATVHEAIRAIKEDIIRSLYSRLMMHCNSLMEDLSTTSAEESKIIHEPPRRVSVYLPHSKVRFTDYLFPGEDTLGTLPAKEQLDIPASNDQQILYESLEVETDAAEFYNGDSVINAISQTTEVKKNHLQYILSFGIIFSIIIVVIAILYQRLRL
ncbi:protein odr-4 homolog [Planococcus citri]|uniref:protein odr-4 homolog n=1 Tax=Planococcus citri TaxID=170843 RepID=UPI0031F78553